VHQRQNARPATAGAVAGVILAVIFSKLDCSQIVLERQDTVEVVDFAAGLAWFVLRAVLATLSPAKGSLPSLVRWEIPTIVTTIVNPNSRF
jgi:hypothetical protein